MALFLDGVLDGSTDLHDLSLTPEERYRLAIGLQWMHDRIAVLSRRTEDGSQGARQGPSQHPIPHPPLAFTMVTLPLRPILLVLASLACGCGAAGAEEALLFGNPVRFCRNGAFPGGGEYPGQRPNFQWGRVTGPGTAPIPFLSDDDGSATGGGCPRADNPQCKRGGTAQPGDRVIVSKTWNGLACVWKQPGHDSPRAGSEQVGWLPLNRLVLTPPERNPPLERWLGTWEAGGEPLVVSRGRKPGELQVEGMAYWPGRLHPNAHSGRLSGTARPVGNRLVIEDPTEPKSIRCRAQLSLLGDVLVVNDNHRCGGVNVNFDGVYQRRY